MSNGRIYTDRMTLNGVDFFAVTADPNGLLSAPIGSIATLKTASTIWVCAGGTVWNLVYPSGGGTDTYTAPNEFYVDPGLPVDPLKRQYQTISAALAAATLAGISPVLVRLSEDSHAWDGSSLDASATTVIYSEGYGTIVWAAASSLLTDGSLSFEHVTFDSTTNATQATGSFTVINAPLAAGDTVSIGGATFTGVAGPRTPGFYDFDASLGTQAALAAEIAAAISDPVNANYATAVAVGPVVQLTANVGGVIGNTLTLSSLTVPPGGVTVSGPTMTGGISVQLTVGVETFRLEECLGTLFLLTADPPTALDAASWTVLRSNFTWSATGSGAELIGGNVSFQQSVLANYLVTDPSYVLPVWDNSAGAAPWGLLFGDNSELNWGGLATMFLNSPGDLLSVAFRNSLLGISGAIGTINVMTGGTGFAGVSWLSSQIACNSLELVPTLLFGDSGSQDGLVLYGFGRKVSADAPNGTKADQPFGGISFRAEQFGAYGQWRGELDTVYLEGSFGGAGSVTLTDIFSPFDPLVAFDLASLFSAYTVRIQGTVEFATSGSTDTAIFDVDVVLTLTNPPGGTFVYPAVAATINPTLLYETNAGRYTVDINVVPGVGFEVVCQRNSGANNPAIRAKLTMIEGYSY